MTSQDIALRRLFSQQVAGSGLIDPAALVKWMGCVRAEDFSAAKWAIGQRVMKSTDASIERAFNEGSILRTHVLQPVKHFISPEDIRWMLALTAPRLKIINKGLYHSLGIDDALLKKSKRIFSRALERRQMTRPQLRATLKERNIEVDDLRLGMLLMDAELDGIICSGSKEGQQFTYSLLEERAPVILRYDGTEAVAELARRYFLSRGPATVYDFSVWSGLHPGEIEKSMEIGKQWLESEVIGGQIYWFGPSGWNDPARKHFYNDPSLFLLPAFDELTTAYPNNGIFRPAVVIDGKVSGNWTSVSGKGTVRIEVAMSVGWSEDLNKAMRKEAERYSAFLDKRLIFPPE